MNLAKKLYDLQLIDTEINENKSVLSDIIGCLENNSLLENMRSELNNLSNELNGIERNRKDLEWTIDDIQKNIEHINIKLYGGAIKNPKELVGFEQELKSFKVKLQQKEDELLELMTREDEIIKMKDSISDKLKIVESNWMQEENELLKNKRDLEEIISSQIKKRESCVMSIDSDSIKIYNKISSKKGNAVVRVEQGKCQGCRLSLSMSELQRARSGHLVQCSSCGMILFL